MKAEVAKNITVIARKALRAGLTAYQVRRYRIRGSFQLHFELLMFKEDGWSRCYITEDRAYYQQTTERLRTLSDRIILTDVLSQHQYTTSINHLNDLPQ
jgi:uncharacterized protein with von Willebrand factor type A (vWA) domain